MVKKERDGCFTHLLTLLLPTMMTPPVTFVLPDLMAGWPFKTMPNPHATKINAESAAWVQSYDAFNAKAQRTFDRCNFGAFAALAYPKAEPAHYRAAVDLINYYFVYDEMSDEESGETVRKQAAAIMNAVRNPYAPPPPNEHILGAMARDFWIRTLEEGHASASTAKRFIEAFEQYTDCVAQQAEDRDIGRIRPIEEYLAMRRGTVGVRPSFDFFMLSEDLPDEAVKHPQIEKLVLCAIDMSILSNDIYSWNVEQAHGDENHNIVSVTMAEKGMTVQEAMDDVGKRYEKLSKAFLDDMKHIPMFPEPVNRHLHEFVMFLGIWVTTNDEWSFITPRYFGEAAPEIRAHRTVELLAKRK
ncbi:terpenoid synthase [Desarmillaria tabescens]|uniref:Terpene synthase n=1 Tax=Armillaria tabescens TaxID=1929756 RepID=A0AA39KFC0_ARMTA|nr:terpenoid synthase [Desarmillaria tabescens]KAK0458925.1 terpenoid synthase [Desarmillaria tabescens]